MRTYTVKSYRAKDLKDLAYCVRNNLYFRSETFSTDKFPYEGEVEELILELVEEFPDQCVTITWFETSKELIG